MTAGSAKESAKNFSQSGSATASSSRKATTSPRVERDAGVPASRQSSLLAVLDHRRRRGRRRRQRGMERRVVVDDDDDLLVREALLPDRLDRRHRSRSTARRVWAQITTEISDGSGRAPGSSATNRRLVAAGTPSEVAGASSGLRRPVGVARLAKASAADGLEDPPAVEDHVEVALPVHPDAARGWGSPGRAGPALAARMFITVSISNPPQSRSRAGRCFDQNAL